MKGVLMLASAIAGILTIYYGVLAVLWLLQTIHLLPPEWT